MRYNLFLDDIRQPNEVANYCHPSLASIYRKLEWVIVRNYEQFVETVREKGLPDIVSFDHDLSEIHYDPSTWTESFRYKEKTGYDCAKWFGEYIVDNKLKIPDILIHSQNPVGKENITCYFSNFKKYYKWDSRE